MSDYYKILGITIEANQVEIKKAFRDLALKYHPDKNKNSSESKQRFMEIVEAYEVLSNSTSKQRYDDSLARKENIQKFHWKPSADFDHYYSYENLKNRYNENQGRGGMWDISEKANFGLWKATMVLLGSLALVAIFIMLKN